ncbi:MAG TPA: alcohol dehydrogenase, partial [Bacteroidetes bacterium]|nr:alcohol dehydrogenase [Bacteroidota bacterium]
MKAMLLRRIVSLDRESAPLEPADMPVPAPGKGEVLI